jgi:hypothetical protein
MSDENRNVNFRLKVSNDMREGFRQGEKEADGFLERMARKAKEMRHESSKTGESALRRTLEGGLGEAAASAIGVGLPAAVLSIAVDKLTELSSKAVEIRNQFSEGKLSKGEFAENILGQVPGFGLGRNIREFFTDEEGSANRAAEQNELRNQFKEKRGEFLEVMRKDREKQEDVIYDSKSALRVAELYHDPIAQQHAALEEQAKALEHGLEERQQEAREKIAKDAQPTLDAINQRITSMRERGEDVTAAVQQRRNFTIDVAAQKRESDSRIAEDTKLKVDKVNTDIKHFEEDTAFTLKNLTAQRHQQTIDMETANSAARLKMEGKGLDAELVLIRQHSRDRLEEVDRQLEIDKHTFGDALPAAILDSANRQHFAIIEQRDRDIEDAKLQDPKKHRAGVDLLYGVAGELLNNTANLPGAAYSPDMRAAQYKLTQIQTGRSLDAALDDLAKDRAELAPLAQQGKKLVAQYLALALSPDEVNRATVGNEGPLRLAGAEDVGTGGYTGFAEAARAEDLHRQTTESTSIQKEQLEYQKKIVDLLQQMINKQNGNGNPPSAFGDN